MERSFSTNGSNIVSISPFFSNTEYTMFSLSGGSHYHYWFRHPKHTNHCISCRLGSCCCQCHKMQARWKETTQVSQLTEFFTKLFSPTIAKIMSNLIYSLTYHFLTQWASSTTKATIRSIIDGLRQISLHSVKKCFWIRK